MHALAFGIYEVLLSVPCSATVLHVKTGYVLTETAHLLAGDKAPLYTVVMNFTWFFLLCASPIAINVPTPPAQSQKCCNAECWHLESFDTPKHKI